MDYSRLSKDELLKQVIIESNWMRDPSKFYRYLNNNEVRLTPFQMAVRFRAAEEYRKRYGISILVGDFDERGSYGTFLAMKARLLERELNMKQRSNQ